MIAPSHADAFEALCLQAADDGRGSALFGDCIERVRTTTRPFFISEKCPDAYLEFPLIGSPFLDVTLLYSNLKPGSRVNSTIAAGTEPMLDWFSEMCGQFDDISCGYELDTSKMEVPPAAVHFQPRKHSELVEPFCKVIGEAERAKLYLDCDARLPQGWKLSFFGIFRGRPGSALRVCGYLGAEERNRCAHDPRRFAELFNSVGFTAYNNEMLDAASTLLATSMRGIDFQFDVYPDGTLGDTFALDAQFELTRAQEARKSFSSGTGAHVMQLLESWGIVDRRWEATPDMAFTRSIPIELEDGSLGKFGFTLLPQWVKVRWRDGVLQPSKLYYLAASGVLDTSASS
jgi:hypothetical protein